MSRRYPGYARIHHLEYRRALLKILREDAADLIEMFNMRESIDELESRLNEPALYSTYGKLTRGILNMANAKSPLDLNADVFNLSAEKYYRTDLRNRHIRDAFELLREDMIKLENASGSQRGDIRELLDGILKEKTIGEFLDHAEQDIIRETAPEETLGKLVEVILVHIHYKTQLNRKFLETRD